LGRGVFKDALHLLQYIAAIDLSIPHSIFLIFVTIYQKPADALETVHQHRLHQDFSCLSGLDIGLVFV
jgi:hypothetical protein